MSNTITSYLSVFQFIDPPSIPMLSLMMDNIETLTITVTPPSVSPVCVFQYNIKYSSSCDDTITKIIVDPNSDPMSRVQLTLSGFNLCHCNYTFTVTTDTRNGFGERSDPISRGSLCKTIVVLLCIINGGKDLVVHCVLDS